MIPSPTPAKKGKKSPQQQYEERLGLALVNRGDIKREELDEALANQVLVGGHLSTCLWELGIERVEKLAEYSATALRLKYVPAKVVAETPDKVLKIFNKQFVGMHRIIPLAVKNKELSVATCEPWNLAALDEAAFHSRLKIQPFFCSEVQIMRLMEELYGIDVDGRFQTEPQLRNNRKPYVPAAASPAAKNTIKLASAASLSALKSSSTPSPKISPPPAEQKPSTSVESPAKVVADKDKPVAKRFNRLPRQSPIEKVRQRPPKPVEPPSEPTVAAPPPSQPVELPPPPAPEVVAATPTVPQLLEAPPPADEIFELTDVVLEADAAELSSDDDEIAAAQAAMAEAQPAVAAAREWPPLTDMKEAYRLLDAAADRDELGEILVRVALAKGARALLFTRTGDTWRGWVGAGPGVASHSIKSLTIPTEKGTCFGLVGVTGAQFLGPLQNHPTHTRLLESLGGQKPASAGLFPVHYKGRVVFGIYLDGGDGKYIDPNIADILILAQKVPIAIERLIRERQTEAVEV